MADNRVFGKIEYGFREALQKLSDSMKDASAIVGKWKDICTSDQPTITLTLSDGTHEVMTLTGIKDSLTELTNKTTGMLIRNAFKAESGGRSTTMRPLYTVFHNEKHPSSGGAKVPSYRCVTAFADVIDVYRLSSTGDTDQFSSLFYLPKVLEISSNTKLSVVDDARIHKVAIRSTQAVGGLPYYRDDTPEAPFATEFYIQNDLPSPTTIEFYSGADFGQKVASIVIPAHIPGRLRTAVHLLCVGAVGAPVSITRVV